MSPSFFQRIQYEFQSIRCEPIYHNPNNNNNRYRQYSLNNWIKYRLRNRSKLLLIIFLTIITLILMYIGGVFIHPFEISFNEETFHYPIYLKDFQYFIENAKKNLSNNALKPINNYSYNYHLDPNYKCINNNNNINDNDNNLTSLQHQYPTSIKILLVIKSATCNFVLRNIIRQTWGNEHRFSDVEIRTVFILGECQSSDYFCTNTFHHYPSIVFSKKAQNFRSNFILNKTINCQKLINIENNYFNDTVQANFIDSYYNNTKKTMASLQWTAKNCQQIPFILFVDDDYYISMKNLLKFTNNYLNFITTNNNNNNNNDNLINTKQQQQQQQLINQYDGRLYVGYLFPSSHPLRHLTSKWYISLDDYQWDHYPPYITGGLFLINNQTLLDLYFASLYSQPFKYDDVYLGILAYRMNIKLIDNKKQIHFYPLDYNKDKYSTIIGSHGYNDPKLLWEIWNEQKSLGYA